MVGKGWVVRGKMRGNEWQWMKGQRAALQVHDWEKRPT